jgi:hypothetical protein
VHHDVAAGGGGPTGGNVNVDVCLTGASVRERDGGDSWTSMVSVGASSVQQVREVRRAWTTCGAEATKWPSVVHVEAPLRRDDIAAAAAWGPTAHSSQLPDPRTPPPQHHPPSRIPNHLRSNTDCM